MRATCLVGAVVCLSWLWLFRGPLFLGEVCALRDAGNFYYPLFSWQCAEWSAGRIPLWNSLDGLGVPALADGTSSVLYPGKLIFALPISFDLRFNLYIAGHVLFAACSVYWVTRRWGASEFAAGIGALSYACGGDVLFQHCNPVFLVSAAWLPLAIWLADAMLGRRSPRRAVGLGAVLALMVLGGDPQTACHAGILATVYAWLLWRSERGSQPAAKTVATTSMWIRVSTARPMLLGLAASTTLGLAAVQVLPTWEWTRRSDRAQFDVPRSIYEIASARQHREHHDNVPKEVTAVQSLGEGLFATPRAGTHAARTYYFSLGPWRLIELLWPNVSGRTVPIHQRWLSALAAEGKVWTPTLYLGLIPLLAAITAWRGSNQPPRERWLKWLVVLGVVGSFGWFGLGWIIHELRMAVTGNPAATVWIGQPVGGWYWLLVTLLPGYAYFRYPAKWFVVAALGGSLLAARGTDQLLAGDARFRGLAKWLCLVSIAMTTGLIAARRQLLFGFHGLTTSDLYGPLDADGAWHDVFNGGLQVAIGSALMWRVLLREDWRRRINPAPWLLLLTAVDLLVAHQWLIATVPGSGLTPKSRSAEVVWTQLPAEENQPPPRILHSGVALSTPPTWREQSNAGRLAEVVAWEQDSLLYRHHLRFGIAVLDAPTTVRSAEWLEFLRSARRTLPDENRGSSTSDFDWLGLNFWITRSSTDDGAEPSLVQNRRAWPRTWLETANDSQTTSITASANVLDRDAGVCRILRYQPQSVEVEVKLTRPAILVLSDTFDPNWVASSRDPGSTAEKSLTTKKVRGLVRGVELSAGDHLVTFQYRPQSFYWGAAITMLSLTVIGIGLHSSSPSIHRGQKVIRRIEGDDE